MTTFTLTADQDAALSAFVGFLSDPSGSAFVLSGYSGCGKSTLVSTLMDRMDNLMKTVKLINPAFKEMDMLLTATTNKAAENLQFITGHPVSTIHSTLGLRVSTDYKTGVTTLTPKNWNAAVTDTLLFIDEASYIDSLLLDYIFKLTANCKIIFIGDPAQLTPVNCSDAPVFKAGFPTAELTTVVRQAEGNPIIELATQFRHTVNTGEWKKFTPDGSVIRHLTKQEFKEAIEAEFSRPDWKFRDSKILAWTNKRVIAYNEHVRNHVKGSPHFEVGDYANNNNFANISKGVSLKTDQMVYITNIREQVQRLGVHGKEFELDHRVWAFMPNSLQEKQQRMKQARDADDWKAMTEIDETWVDLRAIYAQTVNKSQGSTYDRVFIDLSDIARCNSGNQIARMLYVACSRARLQVFLTGDFA